MRITHQLRPWTKHAPVLFRHDDSHAIFSKEARVFYINMLIWNIDSVGCKPHPIGFEPTDITRVFQIGVYVMVGKSVSRLKNAHTIYDLKILFAKHECVVASFGVRLQHESQHHHLNQRWLAHEIYDLILHDRIASPMSWSAPTLGLHTPSYIVHLQVILLHPNS